MFKLLTIVIYDGITFFKAFLCFDCSWLWWGGRWFGFDGHTDICDRPSSHESYSSTSSPGESGKLCWAYFIKIEFSHKT